jgi:hypothetical protein
VTDPEWILWIDGDEVLERSGPALVRGAVGRSRRFVAYSLRVAYAWHKPEQFRVDVIYGNFRRPSLFRIRGKLLKSCIFRPPGLATICTAEMCHGVWDSAAVHLATELLPSRPLKCVSERTTSSFLPRDKYSGCYQESGKRRNLDTLPIHSFIIASFANAACIVPSELTARSHTPTITSNRKSGYRCLDFARVRFFRNFCAFLARLFVERTVDFRATTLSTSFSAVLSEPNAFCALA